MTNPFTRNQPSTDTIEWVKKNPYMKPQSTDKLPDNSPSTQFELPNELPKVLIDLAKSYNNSTSTNEKKDAKKKLLEVFSGISIRKNGNYVIISGLPDTNETDIHIPEFNPSTVIESIRENPDPRFTTQQKELVIYVLNIYTDIQDDYIIKDGKMNEKFNELIEACKNIQNNKSKPSINKTKPSTINNTGIKKPDTGIKKPGMSFGLTRGGVKTRKKLKKQTRKKLKKQTRKKLKMHKYYHGGIPGILKFLTSGGVITVGTLMFEGIIFICDAATVGACTLGQIIGSVIIGVGCSIASYANDE
jgi:hypothetical protein